MWRSVGIGAGAALALGGVVAAILFALQDSTAGLLLVVCCLLAGVLLAEVTRR